MRLFDVGKNRLHISSVAFEEEGELSVDDEVGGYFGSPEKYADDVIKWFTRRRLYRELLYMYGRSSGLQDYAILDAHGESDGRGWIFLDRKASYPVQGWVDKMDGSSLALLLYCCNHGRSTVFSEKSVILHSSGDIRFKEKKRGGYSKVGKTRIYVPGDGYLDGYRSLRNAIEKYRQSSRLEQTFK